MNATRWNEIIEAAAAQAIDEAGVSLQAVAKRAAELGAEWITEELAEEQRLDDTLTILREAMRRYLPPDSGITVEQFANEIIGELDRR